MIEFHKVNAGYRKNQVLFGLSLNVKKNEIVAIIGPNGAGKSTVLKSLFRFTDIYSGNILFEGKDITKARPSTLIKLGISYVPQGKHIFNNMTVRENLEIGRFAFNDGDKVNKLISQIYNEFPVLEKIQNRNASALSGGQRQMLSIARALIQEPKVLMMDEPTLGLSPMSSKYIMRKLVELRDKKGIAVLLVEQNAKEALRVADRTYVIENGRVALEGDRRLLKNKKIAALYFGKKRNKT